MKICFGINDVKGKSKVYEVLVIFYEVFDDNRIVIVYMEKSLEFVESINLDIEVRVSCKLGMLYSRYK